MAKSRVQAIQKAAERARQAERRVGDAQRALTRAVRGHQRAEGAYLKLISESVGDGTKAQPAS